MLNPKNLARLVNDQLPMAKEQSCGCGGCTCGADEKAQPPKEDTYEILTEL